MTIRPWSLAAVMFLITVCMSPLTFPQPFTALLGTAAPVWYLAAIGAGLLGVYLNERLVEYARDTALQAAARVIDYMRVPFFLVGATFMLGAWLNVVASTILPLTPRYATSLLTLAVVAYALRLGPEACVRLVGVLGLMILPALTFVYLLLVPGMRPGNLLPLNFVPLPWIWPTVLFMTRGYDILPVVAPHVAGRYRTAALVGVGAGSVLLALTLLAPVMVFGIHAVVQMSYPFIRTIGTVNSPYIPFQRLQYVTFIVWQVVCVGIVIMYSMSGIACLGFRGNSLTPWPVVAAWTIPVFLLSLMAIPLDTMLAYKTVWSAYGILLYFIAPTLVIAAGRLGSRPSL